MLRLKPKQLEGRFHWQQLRIEIKQDLNDMDK